MLDDLSDDLLLHCFHFLEHRDLIFLETLSKHLYKLLSHDQLWKPIVQSQYRVNLSDVQSNYKKAYAISRRPPAVGKFRRTWGDWAMTFLTIVTVSDVISDNIVIVRFGLEGQWRWFSAALSFIVIHMGFLCFFDWDNYKYRKRILRVNMEPKDLRRQMFASITQTRMLYEYLQYEADRRKRNKAEGRFLKRAAIRSMESAAEKKLDNLKELKARCSLWVCVTHCLFIVE